MAPEIRPQPAMMPNFMFPMMGVQSVQTQVTEMMMRPATMTSPPQLITRKRTSSGVFQVDDSEPPPKKPENSRSDSEDSSKKTKLLTNGTWNVTETTESEGMKQKKDLTESKRLKDKKKDFTESKGMKDKKKECNDMKEKKNEFKEFNEKKKELKDKKDKVIDKFDCDAKSTCVNAFKESDSWD